MCLYFQKSIYGINLVTRVESGRQPQRQPASSAPAGREQPARSSAAAFVLVLEYRWQP